MAKNVKKTLTKDEKKKVAKTVAKSKKIIDKAKAKIASVKNADPEKKTKVTKEAVKKIVKATAAVNKKVKKAVKDHKSGTGKCSVAAQLVAKKSAAK